VLLVVAGAGSAANLAPEEPRRCLLLVCRRGLVAVGRRDGRGGLTALVALATPDAAATMWARPGSIWALWAMEVV
jgi:hypothetical protein